MSEPFAYFHCIKEPGREDASILSRSPDNPWSHWIKEHRDTCEYSVTPLYTADTIALIAKADKATGDE